ncbi:MAG TPA: hypothetical protein VFV81_07895, partial [Verrucomicrobiae bacterium]|nr:hypothetical protein [Verrucomicrobiae bacterium]
GVALSVAGLEQVLNRTTVPPEALDDLAKAFRDAAAFDAGGEGFFRAMAGERTMHLVLLKDPDQMLRYLEVTGRNTPDENQQFLNYAKQPGTLPKELGFFEDSFQKLLAAEREPFPARLKMDEVIQQRQAEAKAKGLLLSAFYWAGFSGVENREARALADARLAMAAVALAQFHAVHHQYPPALAELSPTYLPATPQDPFDGRSLRYEKKGPGYLLYSIGPDLKDDGGKRLSARGGDMTFAVSGTE